MRWLTSILALLTALFALYGFTKETVARFARIGVVVSAIGLFAVEFVGHYSDGQFGGATRDMLFEDSFSVVQDAYNEVDSVAVPSRGDAEEIAVGRDNAGELNETEPLRWYRFSIGAEDGGRFVLETTGEGSETGVDTVLELFASDGTMIAANDDATGGTSLYSRIEELLEPGEYFLRVRGWLGDTGRYRVGVGRVDETSILDS